MHGSFLALSNSKRGNCSSSELECHAEAAYHKPDRQSSVRGQLRLQKDMWSPQSRRAGTSGPSQSGCWRCTANHMPKVKGESNVSHISKLKSDDPWCVPQPAEATAKSSTTGDRRDCTAAVRKQSVRLFIPT